jgi:hypothetical protein
MIRKWLHALRKPEYSNRMIAICTGVIMLATLAYGVVSFFQLSAISDANRINRESVQAIQRAFLSFQSTSMLPSLRHEQNGSIIPYIKLRLSWENSGNTPAINVVGRFSIEELPNAPTGKVFLGDVPMYKNYIGPKGTLAQEVEKPASFYTGGIDTVHIAVTKKFDRKIFYWAWIVYRDIFDQTKPHLTEVCAQVTLIGSIKSFGETAVPLVIDSTHCEQHNCVDEYCEDYNEAVRVSESP